MTESVRFMNESFSLVCELDQLLHWKELTHLHIRLIRFLCSTDFDSHVIVDWTVELLCEDS